MWGEDSGREAAWGRREVVSLARRDSGTGVTAFH